MNISYFLYSIKLIFDNGGKISRSDFITKMASFIGLSPTTDDGKENRTPYNKSKLPRYFGFIDVIKDENKKDILVLTNRGKKAVKLIKEVPTNDPDEKYGIKKEDKGAFVDLIFESVVFDSFGKNNCGAEQSNTDVEPPKVLFKMLLDLSECSAEEYCYVIFGLNNLTFSTYEEAINKIVYNRSINKYDYKTELESWNVYNIARDCKLINIFTNENIELIKIRKDETINKNVYRLNESLDQIHLDQIKGIKPINTPLRMIVYFNNEDISKKQWINESILGRVASDEYYVEYDEKSGAPFLGTEVDGKYCPGLFDQALLKALSNPTKNVYLAIYVDSEDKIPKVFDGYKDLLQFTIGLSDSESGWSQSKPDQNIYDYLKSNNTKAVEKLNIGEIKIPSNLQIIGVITMGKLEEQEMIDYKFTRAVVDSDPGLALGQSRAKGGFNKIFYGAPGCGKSFFVKHDILEASGVLEENSFRTTFHPDYSNSDFVGQIMPKVEGDKVTYIFNPGPFAIALKQCFKTDKMVYLVIEEINRGNASAIFGDLFQLLDRVKDSSKDNYGESEYVITNVNLQAYLSKELGVEFKHIYLPTNLTILATMNSSDQNVFTLDTAFKRRWAFEQISNDIDADTTHPYKDWFVPGTNISWATFLKKINEKILEFKISNSSSEDKRLGKYFVTKDCLTDTAKVIADCEMEANNFAYKVLEYLWNDVCKLNPEEMFDLGQYQTLEDLIEGFKREQLNIFPNIDFNA